MKLRIKKQKIFEKKQEFKYARLVFFFKNGGVLVFNDMRRFGYAKADFSKQNNRRDLMQKNWALNR